jgi:excisionase family DNA binding protein
VELEIDYDKLAALVARELREFVWLSPREAAAYVGIPAKTLENYRYDRKGPPYTKIGKHVRYRRDDIDAWMLGRCASDDEEQEGKHVA